MECGLHVLCWDWGGVIYLDVYGMEDSLLIVKWCSVVVGNIVMSVKCVGWGGGSA